MASADQPSKRVVLQRMRNQAVDALEELAAGNDGVRAIGVGEYVERFFDIIDDKSPWAWRSWSVFTPDEVAALAEVHDLLVAAGDSTPRVTVANAEDRFIASGWPDRIQPVARIALDLMTRRGRFDEHVEEDEPSRPR